RGCEDDQPDGHGGLGACRHFDLEILENYGEIDQSGGGDPSEINAERSLDEPEFTERRRLPQLVIYREKNEGKCRDDGQADGDAVAVPEIYPAAIERAGDYVEGT